MLANRIIPTLLYDGTTLVKGRQFGPRRTIGHVLQAAEIYGKRSCDEIMFIDIGAQHYGTGPDFSLVERLVAKSFSPITVGGGVRCAEDVKLLLRVGADKVLLGSILHEDESVLRSCADSVGSQALVAAVDYKEGQVVYRSATETAGMTPREAALFFERQGAGEILLTCVDREGLMDGYDLENLADVCASVDVPVIAHGGCGAPTDMHKAFNVGASAAAAGSMFAFTDWTPFSTSRWLYDKGVEVRVP